MFSGPGSNQPENCNEFPAALIERVAHVIARTQHIPLDSISMDKTFEELKIDSLDGMNILFAIESEFNINIPDDQATQIRSVREMVRGIADLIASQNAGRSDGLSVRPPGTVSPISDNRE